MYLTLYLTLIKDQDEIYIELLALYTVNVDIFAQLNIRAPSLWWYISVDKFSRI